MKPQDQQDNYIGFTTVTEKERKDPGGKEPI